MGLQRFLKISQQSLSKWYGLVSRHIYFGVSATMTGEVNAQNTRQFRKLVKSFAFVSLDCYSEVSWWGGSLKQ